MTLYEKLAIIMSAIAIAIPIIQWIWRRWITKPVLKYYSTGKAFLYINRSGSYIKLEGVYEALNKPISVKKTTVKVIRKKDDSKLNLRWSSFASPYSQLIVGTLTSAVEMAHPIKVNVDNVTCAFIEFEEEYQSSVKKLKPFFSDLANDIENITALCNNYSDALIKLKEKESYLAAKEALKDSLFWEISRYSLILTAEYGNNEEKDFYFDFEVTGEHYELLVKNIEETLNTFLKDRFGCNYEYKSVQVDMKDLNCD